MTEPAEKSEKIEIGKASSILAFFTMLSRLLGLVRNQILSHFFGASFVADAFIAAFTIPNALRRLFGEGALTPSIVSLLTRALREKTEDESAVKPWQSFLTAAFVWLTICLVVICIMGIFFARELVLLYVPDFATSPGKLELTVSLTQFLFPFIIFIGWSAFFMGVLNTFRSFAISAFVPAMLSLSVLIVVPLSLYVLFPETTHGIYFYAGALLIGAFVQCLMQFPHLKKFDALPFWDFLFFDKRVLDLGRLMVPSVFSLAIYQLNLIINRTFASGIDGAVAHLFYADLLLELPVSLIAVSLGTAVIPSFSRLLADSKRQELAETFAFSMEAMWALALPCMIGLIALAIPLVSTLYFTGKFNLTDTQVTSRVLIFYSLGLPFFATLRILLALFFAGKNTKTPMFVGFIALTVNALAAWQFSSHFKAPGIAMATSVSSMVNVILLMVILKKHYPEFRWRPMMSSFLKTCLAAGIMGVALWGAKRAIPVGVWSESGLTIF